MQYDMHYHACYALAIAAGILAPDALVVATASQYVDDHAYNDWILADSQSGEGVLGIATAHHPLEAGIRALARLVEDDDSRLVWVPFHFLPGGVGASFAERMATREDGAPGNRMFDYYLSSPFIATHRNHALHLLGIAAHVYADTFAHYGFSGMPSKLNLVDPDSIRVASTHPAGLVARLIEKGNEFKSRWGDYPHLGHAAVLTHPDQPYLNWGFSYEDGRVSNRSNPATFRNACQKLHARFGQFAAQYYASGPATRKSWEAIEGAVIDILAFEGAADERSQRWQAELGRGTFGPQAPCKAYDVADWNGIVEAFKRGTLGHEFVKSDPYLFFVAAEYHRSYVLKRLLPAFGLLVA